MARTGARRETDTRLTTLIENLSRDWSRRALRRLPPEFTAHMRAALRELFLAGAALGESALQAAEARTARVRRRIERIPVGPRTTIRRRATRRRRS